MSRHHRVFAVGAWLAAASCAAAQDPAPAAPEPAVAAAQAELVEHLKSQGITVDLAKQTVTIDAEINPPMDPLEYLLIHRRGKSHEALFVTDVKPSLLNSAFLLLGYEKGTNVRYKPIEPPPTDAEVAAGADWVTVFPPEGVPLYITARWKDEKGKTVTEAVEDLIVDLSTQKAVVGNQWIFLGGRMAALYRGEPPVFVADFEGNLVSLCYLAPENHLATMRHPRARDDANWWYSDSVPPPETPIELCFHKAKPAVVAASERRRGANGEPKTGR